MTRARAAGVLAFAAAFLTLRLVNLGALPVFLDEAIHVDWALRTAETGRLLGISDGGRYLPIWLYALVAPRASDPVLAARACSALSGLLAAFALVWLGRELYGDGTGWTAALLYMALPTTLLYDRMALVDSLLCALVVAGLASSARWARTARLAWAVTAGALAGAAAITKLYGGLLLAAPLLFFALAPGPSRKKAASSLPWVVAAALAAMVPVFLDAQATLVFAAENTWFLRDGPSGSASLGANVRRALAWSGAYLTPLGAVLVALSALRLRHERATLGLVGFWVVWALLFVTTGGRDWFPRYLLPALVPLLLLPARAAARVGGALSGSTGSAAASAGLVLLVGAVSFGADRALVTRPAYAPLLGIDRWQYVTDWPSGYRLSDAAALLRQRAAASGGLVALRDFASGPLFEGLSLLLRRGAPGLTFADVALRKAGGAGAVSRLRADGRPTCLVLEQPTDVRLVLALDGRALAAPLAVLPKPFRRRQVEVHCVQGDCGPVLGDGWPAADPRIAPKPEATDAPGALEEARACALEEGERSLEACRRALGLGLTWPRAAETHYEAGRTLMALGRFAEGAASFAEARRLLPGDLDQGVDHAEALTFLGRLDEAFAVLQETARIEPESPLVHARLGGAAARLGRWTEAEAALRRSLALQPASVVARNDLAVVLHLDGRSDEAVQVLREASNLDSQALYPRFNLAVVLAARPRGDARREEGRDQGGQTQRAGPSSVRWSVKPRPSGCRPQSAWHAAATAWSSDGSRRENHLTKAGALHSAWNAEILVPPHRTSIP